VADGCDQLVEFQARAEPCWRLGWAIVQLQV
jgi:hypothetical protein